METREYTTIDKRGWPDGPWQAEPDKRQWRDEETGFPCLIVRGPGGHLCGYVGVPEGHPWYRMNDGDVPADVHGGLTFAATCSHGPEDSSICHVPAPGEPDNVWWLGFDCAHWGDISPKWDRHNRAGEYRDFAFVTAECQSLARQAKAAALARAKGAS